ncbi:sugar kinase [Prauserella muralis]|uniref:sugar kinase n=1 Tax=Prauserella muralis TaxID=588067 RepID=UPI0011AD9E2B|nr:sugar kinase [Prauserella muralis]TWE22535.1 2-dehydro-3-deoxygluconokinase/dehydrogluconokinase [Prauserella muralis]
MNEPDHALDAVTFGEVMAMFVAGQAGPLEQVEQYRRALAGAEYNVAVGLARLGHRTGWIGRVGDDPFGHYALAELARHGIDASLVTVDPAAPTAFQIKSSAPGGEPRVVYFRAHSAGSRLAPSAAADARVAGARHLHATGIPLALSAELRAFAHRAVTVARGVGATVSVDPNLRPALWPDRRTMVRAVNDLALRADWVLPGVAEGEVLTGRREPEGIAAWYLERGVRLVAVKRGAQGAELYTADGERWSCPPFAVEAVDTVGAGDGFAAGLISASLDGEPREAWLARASAVGALATTSTGDQDGLPDRAALAALVGEGVPR